MQTGLEKLDLAIEERTKRRLSWLGHVLRVYDIRLARQVVYWESNSTE